MKTNTKDSAPTDRTHGGAVVRVITPIQTLRRTVLACLLWEDTFYEGGATTAKRIAELVPMVEAKDVASLAVEARTQMHLRHVPLFLVSEMCRHTATRAYVRTVLPKVIQRADELAEFLAIYWKGTTRQKRKLAKSAQRGLADAFTKFSEYDLAKYRQDDKGVSLKDVLLLVHAAPQPLGSRTIAKPVHRPKYYRGSTVRHEGGQGGVFKRLIEGKLATPDTWEVAISACTSSEEKKAVWTRLLTEKKLGGLALIRNLRNMDGLGVDRDLVNMAIREMKTDKILPFRFVAAINHAPRYAEALDATMLRCLDGLPKLGGHTVVLVDVSGSMGQPLSAKSELNRLDTAATLAAMARELCESVDIYATAGSDSGQHHRTALVKGYRGLALVNESKRVGAGLGGGGIFLKQAIDFVWEDQKAKMATRVIAITDGQDTDRSNKGVSNIRQIASHQYVINIASFKNGVGYGAWQEIDGWSEHVLTYIREAEATPTQN